MLARKSHKLQRVARRFADERILPVACENDLRFFADWAQKVAQGIGSA
jgi:hypothetical protein